MRATGRAEHFIEIHKHVFVLAEKLSKRQWKIEERRRRIITSALNRLQKKKLILDFVQANRLSNSANVGEVASFFVIIMRNGRRKVIRLFVSNPYWIDKNSSRHSDTGSFGIPVIPSHEFRRDVAMAEREILAIIEKVISMN